MELSYLDFFTELGSLIDIQIGELDFINKIDSIIDPKKVLYFYVEKVTGDSKFLGLFINLRLLQIWDDCKRIDFKYFLPQMKALNTLGIFLD